MKINAAFVVILDLGVSLRDFRDGFFHIQSYVKILSVMAAILDFGFT